MPAGGAEVPESLPAICVQGLRVDLGALGPHEAREGDVGRRRLRELQQDRSCQALLACGREGAGSLSGLPLVLLPLLRRRRE